MVDFVNRDTGEQVKGIKLHFTCPDDRVSGEAATTQFIREGHACYQKATQMPLGEFTIIFGQRGSVFAQVQEYDKKRNLSLMQKEKAIEQRQNNALKNTCNM